MKMDSTSQHAWSLFNFSSTERRLLLGLSFLSMAFWFIPDVCSGFRSGSLLPANQTVAQASKEPLSRSQKSQSTQARSYPRKAVPVFELNRADTLDLESLYGIGPSLARRIVKYRDKLGGFFSVDQLLEVWGIDSTALKGFRDRVWVDPRLCIKKDLNAADFNSLRNFPYLDHYQAKEVYLYRVKQGRIRTFSELRSLPLLDSTCLQLIEYYWSLND